MPTGDAEAPSYRLLFSTLLVGLVVMEAVCEKLYVAIMLARLVAPRGNSRAEDDP